MNLNSSTGEAVIGEIGGIRNWNFISLTLKPSSVKPILCLNQTYYIIKKVLQFNPGEIYFTSFEDQMHISIISHIVDVGPIDLS